MYAMEANVSKYTNAIGSSKQAITQRQKRKGGRGMKEGWEYKKLGDLCDIYQPKTLATEQLVADGKYYVYGANGIIGRYNDYNHEQSEILLTCRGATCGTINISQPYSWINGNAMVIHRKSEDLSFDFLKYLMLSLDYSLIITGAAQPQITRQKIAPIIVKFPSLSVQHSIVSELDKINELIRLKKEQLKDYDNLAQSIFYEMFGDPVVNEKGWDVKKLGEEYKVSSSKRIMQDEWTTEGVPFLKVSDVVSKINGQNSEPSTFISETTYSKLVDSNAVPFQNDILITSRGTLGLCYIVKNEDRFYFQDGMITWLAECKGNITPFFLTYLFKNHHFLQQITSKANKSTVAYISISQISKRKIPLPPLALQNLFAQRIELIEQQKAEIKSTIADLETLLASRMQYWFFGF